MTTPEKQSEPTSASADRLSVQGERFLLVTKKLTDTVRLLLESQELGDQDKERLLRLSSALYDASNLLADTAEAVEKRFDSLGAHVQKQPEKIGRKPRATIEVDGQVIAVSAAAKEVWDILCENPNISLSASDIYEKGFRPDVSSSARQLALSGATRQLRGLERDDIPALVVTEGASRSTRYRVADAQVATSPTVPPQPLPIVTHTPKTDTIRPTPQPQSELAKRIFEVNDIVTGTVSAILEQSDRPVMTIREIIHHAFGKSIDTPTYEALKAVLASDTRIRYTKGGEYVVIDRQENLGRVDQDRISSIVEDTLAFSAKSNVGIISVASIIYRQQKEGYFMTKKESDALLGAFMRHPMVRYVNGTTITINVSALKDSVRDSLDEKLQQANIHDKKPVAGRRSSGAWR